jgi:hypothetical protein
MAHSDVWAVSPSAASAAYFRAAATHGAGALTLLQSNFTAAGAINGCGYRVTLTSVGDLTGVTYTIVGTIVGQQSGTTTEAIAGGSTATVTTTNYWSSITSITASGTSSASTLSVGYAANLALPRTRIKGWSYVGAASAGSIAVTINSTSGTNILTVDTPASTAAGVSMLIPGSGILVGRSASNDFGIVVLTQITKATLYCG